MIDILIIIFAMVLFTVLAFRQFSAVILGPLVGIIVCILSRIPVYETMMGPYMEQTSNYVKNYFFIFFLGALFGAVYEKSGAATSIAEGIVKVSKGKFTAPMITIITGILTLGGISGFVVFFVVYPIALKLFRESNISRRLLPGAISAGCWTFSMILPISPSNQNIVASRTLGTLPQAAMVPGFVGGIFELVLIIIWLEWRARKLRAKGLGFHDDTLTPLPQEELTDGSTGKLPNFWVSLLPIVVIILLFNVVFKKQVEIAILIGLILAMILQAPYLSGKGMEKYIGILNKGGANSVSSLLNTALVVGFGGVVVQTQGFQNIVNGVLAMDISPLVFVAVATAICAGAVGSASGGITIALESLKDTFINLGVNLEYVHRIAVISAGTLDTLPHQGAQITLLNICHLTHKEGYYDIAITQIVIPILALFVVIPLSAMGL